MPGLKDVLEGKPLRVPVHAAIVHFPLACFGVAVLFDLASWVVSDRELRLVSCAFWSTAGGVATALVAALFGFVDYTSIRDDHRVKKTATVHMVLNLIAVVLFGLSLGLRYEQTAALHTAALPLVVSLVGFALLMVSGYLGGSMVYNDGVGVGRHRRRAPLPEKTIERPSAAVGEFTSICRVEEVAEGQALRASVDGNIIALAKSGGEFFAVQEFCTHRYGPLSEGKIEKGQVVCPWHGSCFELKSGRVAAGPAKVELKTYEVVVRDGQVWIKVQAKP